MSQFLYLLSYNDSSKTLWSTIPIWIKLLFISSLGDSITGVKENGCLLHKMIIYVYVYVYIMIYIYIKYV